MIKRYIILALTIAAPFSAMADGIPSPLTSLRMVEAEGVLQKWSLLDTKGDDSAGYTFLIEGPDTNQQWLAIGDLIAGLTIYGYDNGRVMVSNATQRSAIGPAPNEMKFIKLECVISNQLSGVVQRAREQDSISVDDLSYSITEIRRNSVVMRDPHSGQEYIIRHSGPPEQKSKRKIFEQCRD
jgi:hypothetical protein